MVAVMLRGIGSLARMGVLLHIATGFRRHARVWLQWLALTVVFALIEHVYSDVQAYLTLAADTTALLFALLIKTGLELCIVFYALWLLYAAFLRQPRVDDTPSVASIPSKDAAESSVLSSPSTAQSPKKRADLVREKLRAQVMQKQKNAPL
jgi:hypothetical protein